MKLILFCLFGFISLALCDHGYHHKPKCHTTYKTVYEVIYETIYKKECYTEYDKKCHTVYDTTYITKYDKKCDTHYVPKCKHHYETIYHKKCSYKYDQKVNNSLGLLNVDLLYFYVKLSPLFKFGFNPSLIDGILNVLPYELAS